MSEIYIYHHLGLGDHISCHGIVRSYCEKFEIVNLFVKEHNYENVKYMFNDISNLKLIKGNDDEVMKYINENNIQNIIYVGFKLNNYENLELQFYKMAGVPIEYKRDKFFINRDIEKEKKIFEELKLEKNKYIFLHRGNHEFKSNYIRSDLKIIEPNSYGFFDWMYVIENASEIHCMDSSFICLIDNMKLDTKINLYYHRYIRGYPDWIRLWTDKKWIELK